MLRDRWGRRAAQQARTYRRLGRQVAQVVLQQVESLVEREAPLREDLLLARSERRGEHLGVAPRLELSEAALEADP